MGGVKKPAKEAGTRDTEVPCPLLFPGEEMIAAKKDDFEKVQCAFCKGRGRDPFGVIYEGSICSVCSGSGEHSILKPHVQCAYCKGGGVEFGTRNPCLGCHGRGHVSLGSKKGPLTRCPSCRGGGMEQETKLVCSRCHGTGMLE